MCYGCPDPDGKERVKVALGGRDGNALFLLVPNDCHLTERIWRGRVKDTEDHGSAWLTGRNPTWKLRDLDKRQLSLVLVPCFCKAH